ncbi:MAG: hypothetical protein PCFJNLEI_00610 [Verrucomicrobiae bacterium]|nr:hypothetical protein [Verrucomicrobiae bacterium]
MRRRIFNYFAGGLASLVLVATLGHAADYTNTASGGYNVNATWGTASNPGNTNVADNVVITNGTVSLQTAYAASNDFINVDSAGVLAAGNLAFGLSGATVTLNDGATLTMTPATDLLRGAVIRLNGGVISNTSIGTSTYLMGGELQVWNNSTITHRQTGGGPIFTYGSLDFVEANKTLTFGSEAAALGAATFRIDSVSITNDASVALARQGGTGVQVQFSNVTLSNATLYITNTTGNAATMTFLESNPNMLGTVDIRAGAIVTPGASNAMGSALVNVNDGGILFLNTIYGLSGNTVSLNQGGVMDLPTAIFSSLPSGHLSNAVVRLNGGKLLYSAPSATSGTKVVGGELQVWDDSTLEAAVGGGQIYINDKLDFTVGGKTLTLSKTAGSGLFTFRMSKAVVTNSGTLFFSAAAVSMDAQFDSLEVDAGSTLTVTNATGAGTGTLTVLGNNSGMLGKLDIRSGSILVAAASNSMGTATVTISDGATLSLTTAYGLGTSTTTIKSGGWLNSTVGLNALTNAVVQLAGTLHLDFNAGAGASLIGGIVRIEGAAVMTNRNGSGGGTGTLTFQSLDFSTNNASLRLAGNITSAAGIMYRFNEVTVTDDAALIFSRTGAGAGGLVALFTNVTLQSGNTLAISNATGGGTGTLTLQGNNTDFAGTLDVRSGATVDALVSGVLGTATLYVNGGTLTYGELTAGVNDFIAVSNGTFRATTAVRSYIAGNGRSNQVIQVVGNSSIFTNSAVFVVGTNAAVNNVVTLANGGVLAASAINVGNTLDATANGLVISNGGSVRVGALTIGNNGSTGNFYQVLGGGTASNSVLTIGGPRSGFNTLAVSNATLLSGGAAIVGSGSSNNIVTVSNGGTWDLLGNQLTLGSGAARSNQLILSGGTVNAATLMVTGVANRVSLNAGTLSVQRTFYSNATALAVGDGLQAASLNLTTGGTGHHYFQAGLTIAPAATLRGTGTITGHTTVNGVIAPGFSIGTLTFSNDLTLAGTTLLELNKDNVAGSNDFIRVLGAFTLGGTLSVTNIGAALADGDTFTLFGGTWTGDFALTNLPALSGSLGWDTTQLGVTGTISIIVIPEPTTFLLVGVAGVLWLVGRRRITRAAN